ncbi:MAG: hypothetical protein NZ700_00980 [Gemmataceae bacterium]|nr:hypothetical protein [Gemmataceae bacterium]MDW8265790.1 hypothetical protein [Gemmataceae bacterium]
MTRSPYVRPALIATQEKVPDPTIEVECRLDRLEELLLSARSELTPLVAYDLLAHWAWLRRVRPELIANLEGEAELKQAEQLVEEKGPELARVALTVPNPLAWREETQELDAAYEEADDFTRRSALAVRLWTDLDDAELVAYAACRCGVADRDLEEELDQCRAWMVENIDLFLAASVHIQAVGQALRPELGEEDYDLALTALKYEQFLDAAEEAEAELTGKRVQPLPPAAVEALMRRFQQWQAAVAGALTVLLAAYARSLRRPSAFAAATEGPAEEKIAKWVAPERNLVGYLPLSQEGDLTISFYTPSGTPAVQLAGEPVLLDGVPAVVSPEATATFARPKLAEISENDLRLCLQVGASRIAWELEPA